jgi:hypothetical protein
MRKMHLKIEEKDDKKDNVEHGVEKIGKKCQD